MKREEVISYIKEKYSANPEYLWDDTPDAAIFRHAKNRKWFALVMKVQNEEYLNVKTQPEIVVSREVNQELVFELVDRSYELTRK